MRIAIDIDGVLRDTFTKIEHLYQKYFIDELELVDDDFKYEIIYVWIPYIKFNNEVNRGSL